MYYNNSDAESGENAAGVWDDNYRGIYHLEEKGTTTTREDSTQYNNDMDTVTDFDGDEDVWGIVGGATDFDGTDDILLGPSSNLLTGDYLQTVTFSAWVKHSNSGDPGYISSVKRLSTASTLISLDGDSAGSLGFLTATYDQNPAHDWMTVGTTYNDDDWHYLVATVNGSTRTLYIDGQYKDSDTVHGIQNVSGNTAAFSIGGFSTNNNLFDGTIDEVRFSRIAKTADWINQTYQMIKNQDAYVNFGNEEAETTTNIINNTGSTDIFGYLLMQVQTNTSGTWEWISTQVNDSQTGTKRNISSGNNLDISSIWNSNPWNTTTQNSGYYRADVVLVDLDGNVLVNDTSDAINKNYEFYVDTEMPKWSNNSTSIPSGSNYQPDQNYGFQISWVDGEGGLDDIVFDFNGTNYSYSNIQISNIGDIYYINFTDLTAGDYNYQWHANDTVGNNNSTEQMTYHIIQDSTLTRLFLNGTESDKNNYRIGDVANFTVTLDVVGQDIYLDTNISGWNIPKGTNSVLFNTTSFNESGLYNITGFFNASVGSGYQSSSVTYYATVSGYPANYTDFDDPETTDFNVEPDIENVSQPTVAKTDTAKVTWNGFVNASGADFSSNIIYTNNNVTILSENLNNTFNSSANITIYFLNYTETPVIYKDDELCGSVCYLLSYDSQNLTFNVSHFTSYTTGANSELRIWDENDPEGGGKSIYTDQNVTFFSNYTNSTDGISINGTSVYCNISFNISGGWTEWTNMIFNETSLLYEYNRSFSSSETINWNVSCFGSAMDYEPLNTTDDIIISPGILEVELIYPPPGILMPYHSNMTVNATVYCRHGQCGNIQGTIRYNDSFPYPDTPISISTDAQPFYIQETSPSSLKSCSNNPLSKDEYCNLTWSINATGDFDSEWKVGVLFNSTIDGVHDNHTSNSTIGIIECFDDISVNWYSIDFDDMVTNTSKNPASGNSDKEYNISSYQWSCQSDIWIKGTDFENKTYDSIIAVGNMSWNKTADISSTNLNYDYELIQSDLPKNTNLTTYYWFDLPPTYAGKYNGTVTIKTNNTN
jgi:hypothetical protein